MKTLLLAVAITFMGISNIGSAILMDQTTIHESSERFLENTSNIELPFGPPAHNPKNPGQYWTRARLEQVVIRWSTYWGLDDKIMKRLVLKESSWIYWVHGCMWIKCPYYLKIDPARGLPQIRCSTARDMGFPKHRKCYELQKDPNTAIFFAFKLFKQLRQRWNSDAYASAAYFIGSTKLKQVLKGKHGYLRPSLRRYTTFINGKSEIF